MKTLVAVAAGVLALAAPAWTQDSNDPSEGMARMLQRALQLSDEQTGKVKEILKKQSDEIRGVLNDEQKERYAQMNRAFGGGGGRDGQGGGGGFGNFGRGGGGWYPSTDDLKTQLTHTDDQVNKINEVRDAARQELRNFWRNRGQGGGNPGEEFQAFTNKLRDDSTKKIKDLLTDEQKPKFDEIVKNYQAQQPAPGADRGRGGDGRRGGSIEERVARTMEALRVEDAKEAEAIKAVVTKVVELMDKLEAAQREGRTKIEDASRNRELSDEAVGDRIDEVRKSTRDLEKELATARKDLADIVTNRQELELLRRGILR